MINSLPPHKCGLTIYHNPHKNGHQSVEEFVSGCDYDDDEWATEDSRQRASDTDELWVMQWYPETPIGFVRIAAATFNEMIEGAATL